MFRKIAVGVGFRGTVSQNQIRKVLAEKLLDAIEEEIHELMVVRKEDDFFSGDDTYHAYVVIEEVR